MILSGDVALNPGPIRFPCKKCEEPVRKNQQAIQCDICDLSTHNITMVTNQANVNNAPEIDETIGNESMDVRSPNVNNRGNSSDDVFSQVRAEINTENNSLQDIRTSTVSVKIY